MARKTRKKSNNMMLWLMLAAIVVIAAIILLLPSCSGDKEATIIKQGDAAPDFTVEMFDGSQTTLSQLRGKTVLVNFWATWCPPCREELMRVQSDIIDRFAGAEFVFLPISRGEDRQTVAAFRDKTGYTFPMGLDPQQTIYGLYATNYIPRNFLIDKNGKVLLASIGYEPAEFDLLIKEIETALK